MVNFLSENPEIDNSGTNEEPLNLGWIRGKRNSNGKKLVHKIGERYYYGMATYTSRKDQSKTLKCQDYKDGCGWSMIIQPLSLEHDGPDHFATENWIFKNSRRHQEVHTCGGIPKKNLNELQFRNHVREECQKNKKNGLQGNSKQLKHYPKFWPRIGKYDPR